MEFYLYIDIVLIVYMMCKDIFYRWCKKIVIREIPGRKKTQIIIIIIIIIWLRKGNLMRETESLLIVAQDNAIRTNNIKARIDKTQQNSKCRLCSDRDETINHIISECSKLAQKEKKAWHAWVGKVIHWEMCRKFQFDHINKRYMHIVHCTTRRLS